MQAIGIVGWKKTGKTTLAADLCRELATRGVRVAAVKSTSHGRLDKQGTDTDRFLAHCTAVAATGAEESAVFWNQPRYVRDLLPLLDADLVVVEGGKSLGWLPRVLVPGDGTAHPDNDPAALRPEQAVAVWGSGDAYPGLPVVDTVSALADLALEKGFVLPGLDCGTCGKDDCATYAALVVAGKASAKCPALRSKVAVSVDGVPVGMNSFVERVLAASMTGVLKELKGFTPGTVTVTLKVD